MPFVLEETLKPLKTQLYVRELYSQCVHTVTIKCVSDNLSIIYTTVKYSKMCDDTHRSVRCGWWEMRLNGTQSLWECCPAVVLMLPPFKNLFSPSASKLLSIGLEDLMVRVWCPHVFRMELFILMCLFYQYASKPIVMKHVLKQDFFLTIIADRISLLSLKKKNSVQETITKFA